MGVSAARAMSKRKPSLDLKPGADPAPIEPVPPQATPVPDRGKSVLIAHISHGLRTPLNAIIGFSEIMEREMFGKIGIPRYIEYVKDIRSSAQHLMRLIEDVVDISKAEAGALELEEDEIDAVAAVRSVCLKQREKAGQVGVQIVHEIPAELPRLLGDRRRVRQILTNLVSNAVRFTSKGGRVTVSAWLDPAGRIVFSIADTGTGIEPAEIPSIFDPFAGLGRLQDVGGGGTGLGLPLCKGLMELHGGTIELVSQPGKGTTVTATFPAERTIKAKPANA
jgi:two-component system, cell cycle sensor histidine kinase PleC